MNKNDILEIGSKIQNNLKIEMQANVKQRMNQTIESLKNSSDNVDANLITSFAVSFAIEESQRFTVNYVNEMLSALLINDSSR